MDVHEVAYTAGFLDGEATFSIGKQQRPTRKSPTYTLYVSVNQVCQTPLLKLQSTWGGTLGLYEKRQSDKHRPRYVWTITGPKCIAMIKEILPYLIVKKEVATVLIEFQESKTAFKPGPGVSDVSKIPELKKRDKFIEKIRKLNKRGV